MKAQYQVLPPTAPVPAPDDVLEETAREGARRLLQAMLEAEVDEYLGRPRYQRSGEFRGYRNGRLPGRTVGVGMGAVEIRAPRVSDVPEGADPFRSEIVERYERRSKTQQRLLARLYLEGLSSGDFEPVFRALVGGTAALSPTSILRLREEWEMEYRTWRERPLASRYAYIYADGVYLKAGLEREKTALLVVIGVRADGIKELLALDEGYRESTESWLAVLRSLRDRGLGEAPLAAVGDGGLGFWAALDEVFPATRHLRCWNHKRLNVLDKLPRRLHKEAGAALSAMYAAPTRADCTRLRDAFAAQLRGPGTGAGRRVPGARLGGHGRLLRLPRGALAAPQDVEPHRVGVRRRQAADQRDQADARPRERPLPGLQAGLPAVNQLAQHQRPQPARAAARRPHLRGRQAPPTPRHTGGSGRVTHTTGVNRLEGVSTTLDKSSRRPARR